MSQQPLNGQNVSPLDLEALHGHYESGNVSRLNMSPIESTLSSGSSQQHKPGATSTRREEPAAEEPGPNTDLIVIRILLEGTQEYDEGGAADAAKACQSLWPSDKSADIYTTKAIHLLGNGLRGSHPNDTTGPRPLPEGALNPGLYRPFTTYFCRQLSTAEKQDEPYDDRDSVMAAIHDAYNCVVELVGSNPPPSLEPSPRTKHKSVSEAIPIVAKLIRVKSRILRRINDVLEASSRILESGVLEPDFEVKVEGFRNSIPESTNLNIVIPLTSARSECDYIANIQKQAYYTRAQTVVDKKQLQTLLDHLHNLNIGLD